MEFRMEAHSALRIVWWCGVVGLLVDIDHAAALLLWRYWNSEISNGRLWHSPVLILSSIAICCLCARGRRLHPKYLLTVGIAVAVVTTVVLVFSPWVTWGWFE